MWFRSLVASGPDRTNDRRLTPPQSRRLVARPASRRRAWRPSATEALEGRALLAASALDSTFGTNGFVLGAIVSGQTAGEFNAVTAIATQTDGKIVTAETIVNVPSDSGIAPLVIRRYNPDGSRDTTFGTDGQTVIPFTIQGIDLQSNPKNLVITSSGQIVIAAEATALSSDGTGVVAPQDLVARLTSTGALDSSFGTGGVFTLPSSVTKVNSVAVTSSGEVVVAGVIPASTGGNDSSSPEVVVVGLTSAGVLDSTFGVKGEVIVPGATAPDSGFRTTFASVIGLQTTPSGQIVVGNLAEANSTSVPVSVAKSTLTRLSANGALDSTFGTGGTLDVTNLIAPNTFVVEPTGAILLGGRAGGTGLVRLTSSGAVDPTFQPTSVSSLQTIDAIALSPDGSITVASYNDVLARLTSNGQLDTQIGRAGLITVSVPTSALPPLGTSNGSVPILNALALTPTGNILVGGSYFYHQSILRISQADVTVSALGQYQPVSLTQVVNDYTGTGVSLPAAELPQYGVFAYRTTTANTLLSFGPTGAGQSIPAPGDYDGDGKSDPAVYLPAYGVLAYRPSTGGTDVLTRFGPTGSGNAIPAPGDYDGDGKTDVALFLPGSATFIVDPSGGGRPYAVQFGIPGTGNAIPAPGDYDGSGKTELAVFLPNLGILAYRSALSNTDVYVQFGPTGAGNAIPVPGDYDGDGKTDIALYLPGNSAFAIRPSGGAAPYAVTFGSPGAGNSVPVPGDYDGDGKTDVAVFLPGNAVYAIDPSRGGTPFAEQFGAAGAGNTIPATAVAALNSGTVSALSLAASAPTAAAEVPVYLPDDQPAPATRRKSTG